jgi:hypothetical protein
LLQKTKAKTKLPRIPQLAVLEIRPVRKARRMGDTLFL